MLLGCCHKATESTLQQEFGSSTEQWLEPLKTFGCDEQATEQCIELVTFMRIE